MKKYKFVEPYQKTGKTTFRTTFKRSGVYLVKENGKLVYIGMSATNLYKTLYRPFERWHHKQQDVVTYAGRRHKYTVRVVLCTPAQAARLEKALIVKHKPRDNENKYSQYSLTLADKNIVETYEAITTYAEAPF